jgi:hypothetical protein
MGFYKSFQTLFGFEDDGRRHQDLVVMRAAFCVRASRVFRPYHISRALGKHHSTILYYMRMHENNMKFIPLYRQAYKHCDAMFENVKV